MEMYEHTFDISEWKLHAFQSYFSMKKLSHIISNGDSDYEYNALLSLSSLRYNPTLLPIVADSDHNIDWSDHLQHLTQQIFTEISKIDM